MRKRRKFRSKRRVYRRYRRGNKRGGQRYWVGRKRIAHSIHKTYPEVSAREASGIMDMTFEGIASSLKRERKYSQPGFGVFRVKHRRARMGRNPFTGERIKIRAKKTIRFRPSNQLRKNLL